jgi:hypothetical protein
MDELQARAWIERLIIPEPNSGCWLILGATRLGHGQRRNYKTGNEESGAGHGWHNLTNALLLPAAQSEPNTGEPATERSIIWFAPVDAQFVESLTRWRTPLSDNHDHAGDTTALSPATHAAPCLERRSREIFTASSSTCVGRALWKSLPVASFSNVPWLIDRSTEIDKHSRHQKIR